MWKSFRFRILMAMLFTALTSVGLLFTANYRNAVETLEHNYLRTNANNASAQIARFDECMSVLYRCAVRAGADGGLREAVSDYLALERPRTSDVIAVSDRLEALCLSSDAVESVYLYLPDKQEMLASNELHHRSIGIAPEAYPWTQTFTGFSPVQFLDSMGGSPTAMFGYSKPILDGSGRLLAVVCTGLSAQTLRYTLAGSADDYANYYLFSAGGEPFSLLGDVWSGSLPPGAAALSGGADTVWGASGNWLYAGVRAPFSGARLLWLAARDELRGELELVRWQFFLLLALVLALALALTGILARWLYGPMESLMEAMGRVGGGDFSPCPEPEQPEEFRQLSRSFNNMIAEIHDLIDDLVQERTAKAEAELRALQSQIQPHFMYNTLNSIKYAAILQGNPKIGEQLGAFIDLLEASIGRKGALLPLSEEIQLLQSYVSLQRYRYMDCFTVEYDIAAEAQGCYVPRLLLQPIVENAILHGMDVKRSDNCIRVKAHVEGGNLRISVEDNGAGMPPDRLHALLEASDHRQFTGIGVSNIRERLRLHYGAQTDFRAASRPGEGTRFELSLPASYTGEA